MERNRQRVGLNIDDIRIDPPKSRYIEEQKGVELADILEVFGNEPRYFVRVIGRRVGYSMLGPTRAGRFLLTPIVPTADEGIWRVVSAYWLPSRQGRRLYEEE
jgi:hypothetical protein